MLGGARLRCFRRLVIDWSLTQILSIEDVISVNNWFTVDIELENPVLVSWCVQVDSLVDGRPVPCLPCKGSAPNRKPIRRVTDRAFGCT